MSNFNPIPQMDISGQISAIKARANARYQRDLLKEYQENQIEATKEIGARLKQMQNESRAKDAVSSLSTAGTIFQTVYNHYKKKKLERLKKLKELQKEEADAPIAEEADDENLQIPENVRPPPEEIESPEEYGNVELNIPSSDSSVYSDMSSITDSLSDASSHISSGSDRLDSIRQRNSLTDEDKEFFENWENEDVLPEVDEKLNDFDSQNYEEFNPYENLPTGEPTRIQQERPLFGADDDVEYLNEPNVIQKTRNMFGSIKDALSKKFNDVKSGFKDLQDRFRDPLGAGDIKEKMPYEDLNELAQRKRWGDAITKKLEEERGGGSPDEGIELQEIQRPTQQEPTFEPDEEGEMPEEWYEAERQEIFKNADPKKGTYLNEPSEDQLAQWREEADTQQAIQKSLGGEEEIPSYLQESGAPAETSAEYNVRMGNENIINNLHEDALSKLPQDERYNFEGFGEPEDIAKSEFAPKAKSVLQRVGQRASKDEPMDISEREALNPETGEALEGAEIGGELGEVEGTLAGVEGASLAVPGAGEVIAGIGALAGAGYAVYSGVKYLTQNPDFGKKLGTDVSDFGKMFTNKNYSFSDFTHDLQNPFASNTDSIPAHRVNMSAPPPPQTALSGSFVGGNPNIGNQF